MSVCKPWMHFNDRAPAYADQALGSSALKNQEVNMAAIYTEILPFQSHRDIRILFYFHINYLTSC